MFFVLDGVMTVQVGDQLHEIAAGGLAWGARGTPHAFANRAKDPLRLMIILGEQGQMQAVVPVLHSWGKGAHAIQLSLTGMTTLAMPSRLGRTRRHVIRSAVS